MSVFAGARSIPRATAAILVVLLAAYAVEWAASGTTSPAPDMLMALGGMSSVAVREGDFYRLLTASLLHGGPLHLVLNCVALFLGGSSPRRWWGRRGRRWSTR